MNNFNGYKILIVDDSKINRAILADIIDDRFEILEAGNGVEALEIIREYGTDISLILLDLVMPDMDGLEVLVVMNKMNLIHEIPVIMISSENSPTYVERAYELGATDFINRPFNVFVVRKRIINTIMLYSKQRNLINLVSQQVYEKEKNSDLMINILSHIVEFRNGESGLHILHVNTITELLLKQLVKKTDKYHLSSDDIQNIVTASSLHDIGKISIPDEILNKPGRLTPEEFEIIKTHSEAGAKMLKSITDYIDEPLVITAYDICMYHHERYDGRGYPCGLKGDEIPISAQVVAIADVYDALVSDRCYKDAIPHQEALDMICNGECGIFNPLLIECLEEISDYLENEIKVNSLTRRNITKVNSIATELLDKNQISPMDHSINYLEQARTKYELFATMSQEIQYEYTYNPPVLTISEWFADAYKLPLVIVNPFENKKVLDFIGGEDGRKLFDEHIKQTTPENPNAEFTTQIKLDGKKRFYRVLCRANWSTDGEPCIIGEIGKFIDIDNEYQIMAELKKQASLDLLTNLYNHHYCEELAGELLENKEKDYAFILFDLDNFKIANDTYGHLFGDKVLISVASLLKKLTDDDDIVARIGGDEFLVVTEISEGKNIIDYVKNIHQKLDELTIEEYKVKVSVGTSLTSQLGYDYKTLFSCADAALYNSKGTGKNIISYYEKNMKLSDSRITPIEN